VLAPELLLPPVGYGIREFEIIANLAPKTGYAKIKSGEVQAFLGCDGRLKVSREELFSYMKNQAEHI
jgi:hypothetical protein